MCVCVYAFFCFFVFIKSYFRCLYIIICVNTEGKRLLLKFMSELCDFCAFIRVISFMCLSVCLSVCARVGVCWY